MEVQDQARTDSNPSFGKGSVMRAIKLFINAAAFALIAVLSQPERASAAPCYACAISCTSAWTACYTQCFEGAPNGECVWAPAGFCDSPGYAVGCSLSQT